MSEDFVEELTILLKRHGIDTYCNFKLDLLVGKLLRTIMNEERSHKPSDSGFWTTD